MRGNGSPPTTGETRSTVFALLEIKARDREARCCTQTINRSSLRQRHARSLQTCRFVIAVCAGARPPSSCTGRTSATEAPTRQRMEARRITTGSPRWPRARQRRVTMGCGPGAVEIGGFSTSSTPGPPSRLRSRQAAPPTANRSASAVLWPSAVGAWGTRWPPTFFWSADRRRWRRPRSLGCDCSPRSLRPCQRRRSARQKKAGSVGAVLAGALWCLLLPRP